MPKLVTRAAIVAAPLFALVGCDDAPDNANRNVSDPIVSINRSADDSGNLSVRLPGLDANIRVPGGLMGNGKVDISGVSLFPGASVSSVNIGGKGKGFSMTFDAPADATVVQKWFIDQFAKKSVTVASTANGLSGTTKEGKAFTIALSPAANGHSTGAINIETAKN